MRFYNIKDEYIAFLRKYVDKVADNKKGKRPYVGVVLEINGMKYYTPFTSPKEKHKSMKNSKDFRKINQGIYGAINFNNMIPVVEEALVLIDIDNLSDCKYRRLLQNQYKCIKKDREQIEKTASKLREILFADDEKLNGNDRRVKQRCCNLPLLERVIHKYKEDKS